METYWRGDAPEGLYSRLELYKAMSDLLWSLWSLIQHANDNPLDDFLTEAQERFGRCERRMNAPGFGRHLNVVRKNSLRWTAQNESAGRLRAE